jgi:hypothetical protein
MRRRLGPLSLFRIEVNPFAKGKGAVTAQGASALGASARGALAVGATALGAIAINRLAIKRAAIQRLEVEELTIGRLRVRELEIEGDDGRVVRAVGSPMGESGAPSGPTAE